MQQIAKLLSQAKILIFLFGYFGHGLIRAENRFCAITLPRFPGLFAFSAVLARVYPLLIG